MDKKIRDRKDTLVNKILLFPLKLANIEPKKVQISSSNKNSELEVSILKRIENYGRLKHVFYGSL
tara:strand:+ start:75997 stop:76191 length:195 start_codon:yes stop_codon:yes gene_type:complete